ncbi:MAG: SAM-dependent methyltransferase [Burkholderiaceae bacterium]|nr:SAM-dependent methyltransferase [Burkholderiaceae bacterium]
MTTTASLTTQLHAQIAAELAATGGWMGFDRFMALALYTPGLGYYANHSRKFGAMPASGSDFVTAPEMTPLFGRTLAVQVAQALAATQTTEVWEFGAGSGALALQLLQSLGSHVARYTIVDLSGTLRERQQEALAPYGDKVRWLNELPAAMQGVIVGNEVLDAMPVQLLVRLSGVWHERGVALHDGALVWADRVTDLRPSTEVPGPHDYLTEIHPQAEAFIRTLADRLTQGAAFFLDYGFPESEYYHPQRHMGTLMCHRAHLADTDPLADVGSKDITAHVNFTGIALAAQDAGFEVVGYASQARFLINCGLVPMLEGASLAERTQALRLINEHEMGELFKVIALAKPAPGGAPWPLLGFAAGDRTHTL